jgi:hypothetical protein
MLVATTSMKPILSENGTLEHAGPGVGAAVVRNPDARQARFQGIGAVSGPIT